MCGTRISIALTLSTATRCAAHTRITSDSRRVQKVEEYIARNYSSYIRLQTLSDMVGMTPTAFIRFFKLRTHTHGG